MGQTMATPNRGRTLKQGLGRIQQKGRRPPGRWSLYSVWRRWCSLCCLPSFFLEVELTCPYQMGISFGESPCVHPCLGNSTASTCEIPEPNHGVVPVWRVQATARPWLALLGRWTQPRHLCLQADQQPGWWPGLCLMLPCIDGGSRS